MGDRAYVEIVCREEDEPLFETIGFMEEFRHALPPNVMTMVDAEASDGATTDFRPLPRKVSYSAVGTTPAERMTELASPATVESSTRCRG